MVPAAMNANCVFMAPVATAHPVPLFLAATVTITSMVREGLALNFIGVIVITLVCYFLIA